MATKTNYRPEIDGLRAIAVLPVLLYHAAVPGFSGGFVGVDVFFVISGFLIARVLLRNTRAGTFSYAHFYERRFRRLLPALTVVLLATVLLALPVLPPNRTKNLGATLFSVQAFASNVQLWMRTDYFTDKASQRVLLHTWSLAVEEQFYLVFPMLLTLVFRRHGHRIGAVLWTISGMSFAASVLAVSHWESAGFFLLPFRAWEMFAGALLAAEAVPKIRTSSYRLIAAVLGMLGILVPVFYYDHFTSFPGLAALPPVVGTALFIHAHTEGPTALGNALSREPWRTLGLISYSLYLWHWPILVFGRIYLREDQLSTPVAMGLLLLSIVVSWVSWRWIEAPFRGKRFTRASIFAMAGSVLALGAVTGLILNRDGFPERFDAETLRLISRTKKPNRPDHQRQCMKQDRTEPCWIGPADGPTWYVVGDSHAGAVFWALERFASERGIRILHGGQLGCPPLLGAADARDQDRCFRHQLDLLERIEAAPPERVIMAARWAEYQTGTRPEAPYPLIGLRRPDGTRSEMLFERSLEDFVHRVRRTGAPVTLVAPTPEFKRHVPTHLLVSRQLGLDPIDLTIQEHRARVAGTAAILQRIAQNPGVDLVDMTDDLCPDGRCLMEFQGSMLFWDNSHYSRYALQEFLPQIVVRHLLASGPAQ